MSHKTTPRMKERNGLIFLLSTSFLLPYQYFSTTVEKLSLEDLVHKSSRIVVGTCVSTESRWNGKNTLILTTSTVEISDQIKGETDGVIRVVTVGGTINGITQTVSGMPQFESGEEVILFLEPSKNTGWQPLGLAQGKLRITKNRITGEKEVFHSLSGLQLYDPSTHTISTQERPALVPLRLMMERIKRLARTDSRQ